MSVAFQPYGAMHLGAVLSAFILPLGLCAARRFSNGAFTNVINGSLVALLGGGEILKIVLLHRDHALAMTTAAPMHLCDWAAVAAMVALLVQNQVAYELCYFWALGGTLQALLTPDLSYDFPDPRFISFFALHGGVVAAALYMTLCLRMRPVPRSILRVTMWSTLYLLVAMSVDWAFGANFGYLRTKPSHPSLLDYMAPWPLYIPELILIGLMSALILYAPFYLLDYRRNRARP